MKLIASLTLSNCINNHKGNVQAEPLDLLVNSNAAIHVLAKDVDKDATVVNGFVTISRDVLH